MKTLLAVLSEQCNLNCAYCNVDKKSTKRIDASLFISQFRKLREQFPTDMIRVDLHGGEPLMQYDLIQEIVETLSSTDDNVTFFMPTNGLLLDAEKVAYFEKYNVEISLSFDGLWQDRNRSPFNNRSSLKKYLDRAPIFQSISSFQIHTMIQRGNYNLLENHLFILNNMGANPDLTLVRDIGTWDVDAVVKLNAGITELFDWYKANVNEVEMPNFVLTYFKHVILYKAKKHEVHSCGAGESLFAFSENTLVPCNRFKDQPDVIDKIPEFRAMGKCATCEVRHYCKKGCLYEQINNNGPIDELCDIYKHLYAEVFKMLAELKTNDRFVSIIKKEIMNEL